MSQILLHNFKPLTSEVEQYQLPSHARVRVEGNAYIGLLHVKQNRKTRGKYWYKCFKSTCQIQKPLILSMNQKRLNSFL